MSDFRFNDEIKINPVNIHKVEIKAHINTIQNENPNKDNIDNIIKDKDNTNKYKSVGINKIKSLFILKIIFNYIEDVNLPYKLFNHSKLLQKKFNIRLDDYKKKYLEQLEFYKLKKTIYFDNPLFKEILSKDTIYILQENIKDNYYNKLNESNLQYSSLYYIFNNKNSIDKLKNLNINFNKIKTMILNEDYRENGKENYDYFFQTLFLLKDIKNNLIYLEIFFNLEEHNEVKATLFESINDMKALRYLYIERINFNNKITIKLSNLKLFYCKKCKNVNLSNIICKNLKTLYYIRNNLLNLNELKSDNFKELKELDLEDNNISDIEALEKVKFDKLEILLLNYNKISNINILKNANLKELKILRLYENNISDINILENSNFKELKELNLYGNNISDIEVLGKVEFKKLERLNLSFNKISNINILQNANFKELKILDLNKNNISDIKVLLEFEKLEILRLGFNKISNVSILRNENFKELKQLELWHNEIKFTSEDVNELLKFKKLQKLELNFDKIEDKKLEKSLKEKYAWY